MSVLRLRAADSCRWDLVSLGEVMLCLDPGDARIATTRYFRVWEGGGEYNVARGLRRCFGLRGAIVTALADNPVGRLIEDLIYQGGSTALASEHKINTSSRDGGVRVSLHAYNSSDDIHALAQALASISPR